MTNLADQVADVLEAAADYIEEHGWCQGHYWDGTDAGAVCIQGALSAIPGRIHTANRALAREDGVVTRWNDTPGREQWEVDQLLRTTAKKIRHGDLEVP